MNVESDNELEALTLGFREFNRFYTDKIGVLNSRLVDSEFSLTEARVLFELFHNKGITAQTLQRLFHIDRGYLSRILKEFESNDLLVKKASPEDARKKLLYLSPKGQRAFEKLNHLSHQSMKQLLAKLARPEQNALLDAMHAIEQILGKSNDRYQQYHLRTLQPGDIGHIAHRQMLLYQQAFDWNINYEVIAAEILCQFVKNFDPDKEQSWIAEANGKIIGSVFLAKESDSVAKLRLLYVEPEARGLGLGTRLVGECVEAARKANYQTLKLWTQSSLISARRIYKHFGFRAIAVESHELFGPQTDGEYWQLDL
ncbi:bifunctional helix-turn-helix transcriptional regulator/GNAT family N-acetyltransferase [Aliikangiella coralliicola]|uniref:MarR family transcriptional regulator n=1 Tax=Aliikangiella coralliicola TaxID=2592383 RepID=A0A545U752_9GAMM|nr:helix-turn-helix domain-containing GNAT family N-acetyltransferase [Aliikangiella coralliicola]TQV85308.1 MarR family transcriptional regulator [Aliikangiella coralliicola]